MLFPSTQSWSDLKELEGLLFYALRLQELSYDQSDFVEKSVGTPVFNIIREYQDVIAIEDTGLVKGQEKELAILNEELKEKIHSDPVCKKLIGDKLDRYINCLKLDSKYEVNNTLELILLKIKPTKYWEELKNQVRSIILNGKQKDKILNLANLTFEFLINYGYEKGTIYHFINTTFFDKSRKNKITTHGDIDVFFETFDLRKREYEVYFVCSRLFLDIEDSCQNFNIEIKESIDPIYGLNVEKSFFKNKENKKSFIKCNKIMAFDYLNAMTVAEEKVSLISDLFVLFHHKKKPWFSSYCLIYNHKKEHVIKSSFSMNSMSKLSEYGIDFAQKLFPFFLENFSLKSESFKRFNRGVELHAHSLETTEASSQILNLWICLETLLITGKGTHISSVETAVKTVVGNYFLKERLSNLHDLLVKWNEEKYLNVRAKLPKPWDSPEYVSVLALVGIIDFKDLAEELLRDMDSTPLLRYKFMRLVRDYQKIKDFPALIEQRNKTTEYDIRRIYRVRNKIVHQGVLDNKAHNIVETAHYYADSILGAIVYNSLINDDTNTIENFLFEQNLFKEEHYNLISQAIKNGLNADNIKGVTLGPDA